jgi:predicted MFS family arabinose efflux permease
LPTRPPASPAQIVTAVCVAEIVGMTPFSMFVALQPTLQREWQLSNTTSGWIASAYYGGYMLAVPVLASLTDRLDARSVWLGATALAAVAAAGFGMIADDVWTALAFQALAGASLAGTYMPGLKLIDDRVAGTLHPRFVAFYTTSFTFGSSGSYFLVGQLSEALPWRLAIATAALGPLLAWILVYAVLERVTPPPHDAAAGAGRWRDVLRSADSMRYVVAYGCHMWELFGMRAWLVPFLTFCIALHGETFAAPTTLAAMVALVGVPASFAGAELSARFDRRRLVMTVMVLSAATGIAFGLAASQSWILILLVAVLYHALVMGDSAALTSGLVAVSPPQSRGTAMALYSMTGFGAASLGSFAVGGLLDLMGGQSLQSWALAFTLIGAANLVGAATLWRGR